jgi:hypothetical protein
MRLRQQFLFDPQLDLFARMTRERRRGGADDVVAAA